MQNGNCRFRFQLRVSRFMRLCKFLCVGIGYQVGARRGLGCFDLTGWVWYS
jgi:hypothetical protein